jgi:hypothetical protein
MLACANERRSFDYASRDKATRSFAQDDTLSGRESLLDGTHGTLQDSAEPSWNL